MNQAAPALRNTPVRSLDAPKSLRTDAPFWLVAIAPISFLLTLLLIVFFLRV